MTAKGPLKFDGGKVRLELVPVELIQGAGRGTTFGAQKYSAGNWATAPGFDHSRLYGGLQRHLTSYWSGEDNDPESGLCHLDHAACMLAFLMAHRARGLGRDDRTEVGAKHVTRSVRRARDARPAPRRKAPKATGRRRVAQGR